MTLRLHVVTGGHPFVADRFFAVFDWLAREEDVEWLAVDAPKVGDEAPDVVLFYDMPGLKFTGGGDPPVHMPAPSDEQRHVFDELQRRGIGMVFMHHAVASCSTINPPTCAESPTPTPDTCSMCDTPSR
jgi:hypothetical protein